MKVLLQFGLFVVILVIAAVAPFAIVRVADSAFPEPTSLSPMYVELEELRFDKMDEIDKGEREEKVIEADYARKAHMIYRKYGYDVPDLSND